MEQGEGEAGGGEWEGGHSDSALPLLTLGPGHSWEVGSREGRQVDASRADPECGGGRGMGPDRKQQGRAGMGLDPKWGERRNRPGLGGGEGGGEGRWGSRARPKAWWGGQTQASVHPHPISLPWPPQSFLTGNWLV